VAAGDRPPRVSGRVRTPLTHRLGNGRGVSECPAASATK
jgi:hypothetical protein